MPLDLLCFMKIKQDNGKASHSQFDFFFFYVNVVDFCRAFTLGLSDVALHQRKINGIKMHFFYLGYFISA